VAVFLTAVIRTKLDKFDELMGATLTALGAEVPLGVAPGIADIYAGAKVKGKMIDGSKLPFSPGL
jgi:hypothetical protein